MDVEEIMEQVCDRCHYPYIIDDQEQLDERCEACPIEAMLKQLANKEE
ncbi:MAG: hypothetical protein IKY92_03635 [Akkermansia sp.]|nr:hypothetical protein [Akkermansia sp.]